MSKTVLIVEDNELNMRLFNDLLQAHGFDTVQTMDGQAAVELARENTPDLILMDIRLTDCCGLEIAKKLKADDDLKHIPVVAITALSMKGDEERIRQNGCDGYIKKPVSLPNFFQTMEKFLG